MEYMQDSFWIGPGKGVDSAWMSSGRQGRLWGVGGGRLRLVARREWVEKQVLRLRHSR